MSPRPRGVAPRAWIAGAVVVVGLVVFAVTRGDSPVVAPSVTRHKVDLVASVDSVNVDPGWSQDGGRTRGAIRLNLDDLRTVTILEGTMVDDYSVVPACTQLASPNACVLLADMLGDAVVWYALVPADAVSGREFLTLPGLVDMQANGDEGILRNGWIVKLATPVVRDCEKQDTSNLRAFITRFPDTASQSIVNLTTDNVVRVRCL